VAVKHADNCMYSIALLFIFHAIAVLLAITCACVDL
jgi:hypothetical protein